MHTNRTNRVDEAIDASEPEPPEPSETPEPIATISVDDGIEGVDEGWLLEHVVLALKCIDRTQSSVAIRIMNDVSMSELHMTHSGILSTTDVLTFNHGSSDTGIDTDIAICRDVAARTATKRNHDLNAELLLYIVHGILHCVGHDDHDETAHQKMHAEEDRILTSIGVGAVWSQSS